jgi:hypothetical protein
LGPARPARFARRSIGEADATFLGAARHIMAGGHLGVHLDSRRSHHCIQTSTIYMLFASHKNTHASYIAMIHIRERYGVHSALLSPPVAFKVAGLPFPLEFRGGVPAPARRLGKFGDSSTAAPTLCATNVGSASCVKTCSRDRLRGGVRLLRELEGGGLLARCRGAGCPGRSTRRVLAGSNASHSLIGIHVSMPSIQQRVSSLMVPSASNACSVSTVTGASLDSSGFTS